MSKQDEVDEAKRAAQLAIFNGIASAAAPTACLTYPHIEMLARSYRYAAGCSHPDVLEVDG